jgi:hypothetical protein
MSVTMVNRAFTVPDLDPVCRTLLVRLAHHAARRGPGIYPNKRTLAAELGMTVDQLDDALAHLETQGHIDRPQPEPDWLLYELTI